MAGTAHEERRPSPRSSSTSSARPSSPSRSGRSAWALEYAALAEAVREEVERDRSGTIPRHARLKAIGYVGWSELLSQRGA